MEQFYQSNPKARSSYFGPIATSTDRKERSETTLRALTEQLVRVSQQKMVERFSQQIANKKQLVVDEIKSEQERAMIRRKPELAKDVNEEVIDRNLARILADDYLYTEISQGLRAKTHFDSVKKVASEIIEDIRERSELEATY